METSNAIHKEGYIKIQTPESQEVSLQVNPQIAICNLRKKVAEVIGVPVPPQRIYLIKDLSDERILSNYAVPDGHIMLLARQSADTPSQGQNQISILIDILKESSYPVQDDQTDMSALSSALSCVTRCLDSNAPATKVSAREQLKSFLQLLYSVLTRVGYSSHLLCHMIRAKSFSTRRVKILQTQLCNLAPILGWLGSTEAEDLTEWPNHTVNLSESSFSTRKDIVPDEMQSLLSKLKSHLKEIDLYSDQAKLADLLESTSSLLIDGALSTYGLERFIGLEQFLDSGKYSDVMMLRSSFCTLRAHLSSVGSFLGQLYIVQAEVLLRSAMPSDRSQRQASSEVLSKRPEFIMGDSNAAHELSQAGHKVYIKVQTPESQEFHFHVNPQISIRELKEEGARVTGVSPQQQRIYLITALSDERVLSDYAVPGGPTLLFVPLRLQESSSLIALNQPDPFFERHGQISALIDIFRNSKYSVQDNRVDMSPLSSALTHITRILKEDAEHTIPATDFSRRQMVASLLQLVHSALTNIACSSYVLSLLIGDNTCTTLRSNNLRDQILGLVPILHQLDTTDIEALIHPSHIPINDAGQMMHLGLPVMEHLSSKLDVMHQHLREIDEHSAPATDSSRTKLAHLLLSTSSVLSNIACVSYGLQRLMLNQMLRLDFEIDSFDSMVSDSLRILRRYLSDVGKFLKDLSRVLYELPGQ